MKKSELISQINTLKVCVDELNTRVERLEKYAPTIEWINYPNTISVQVKQLPPEPEFSNNWKSKRKTKNENQ